MKTPTTIKEQVEILKKRGMIIKDESAAQNFLSQVNYYKLAGYTFFFRQNDDNFRGDITFEYIQNIYELDNQMRMILFKYLSKIEIAFKTRLSYEIAHKIGPATYLTYSSKIFIDENRHNEFLSELHDEKERCKNLLFIKHHNEKYNGQLPLWVAVEIMTFSQMSKFYKNLQLPYASLLGQYYDGIQADELKSWFQLSSTTRNACAHHNRIYKSQCLVQPKNSSSGHKFDNHSVFNCFRVVAILLRSQEFEKEYMNEIDMLKMKYSDINFREAYQFPKDWKLKLQGGIG